MPLPHCYFRPQETAACGHFEAAEFYWRKLDQCDEQVLRSVSGKRMLDRPQHVAWLELWGLYGTSKGASTGACGTSMGAFVGPLGEALILEALVWSTITEAPHFPKQGLQNLNI